MAGVELQALKRGRAYQCLDCEKPMVPYTGERRQVIAHLYKSHVSLDRVPFFCSLCHFLTAEKDKLAAHIKNYTKHVDAVKALERSGGPMDNFLKTNSNPLYVSEGVHYTRLSREESRLHWMKMIPTGPQSSAPASPVAKSQLPEIAQSAPLATVRNLPEETATVPTITFNGLIDEDLSFLDPFLDGTTNFDQGSQIAIEKEHQEDMSERNGRVIGKTAPRKDEQEAKRKRRDSSSSSSSSSSNSSNSSEDNDTKEEEATESKKEDTNVAILEELRKTNQHLFLIYSCVSEIKTKISETADSRGRDMETGRNGTIREDSRTEERREERMDRLPTGRSYGWQGGRRWNSKSYNKRNDWRH